MLRILAKNFEDDIEDCARKSYGHSPITYGDYYVDDEGNKIPKETILTPGEDQRTG